MRNGDPGFPQPMRLELATSEMEGGDYLAWADPEQVVACVVHPQPLETFSRFIEPQFAGLDRPSDDGPPVGSNQLPERLQNLLGRLRRIHTSLVQENRSVLDLPYTARLTLAMVEENRVFFVKGTPCWIYLVRDRAASLAAGDEEAARETAKRPALGGSDRLNLQLSSIEVAPRDIAVLLAAEGGECPDRRAVAQVFAQTSDLKRACDGLVNLLGLQSSGAAVVAMRFVPVGSARNREVSGSGVIKDLERELAERVSSFPDSEEPSTKGAVERFDEVGASEVPLPAFLEEAGTRRSQPEKMEDGSARKPDSLPPFRLPWETPRAESAFGTSGSTPAGGGGPDKPGRTTDGWRAPAAVKPDKPGKRETARWGGGQIPNPPAGHSSVLDEFPPPGKGGASHTRFVLLGIVFALLIAVVSIPQLRFFAKEPERVVTGVLRINPDPPARAIFVDGVDMRTGSPAVLEQLEEGLHHVKLDLGSFGVVDSQVQIVGGETTELRPVATGSLEITAAIPQSGAMAWVKGREPREVPCRFDSLPVGWVDAFYEDAQLPLWQREVVIRAGQTFRLRVNNAVASDRSLLRIESWIYRDGEGMVESPGDSLLIDGRFAGFTPWEQEVLPGLHGVRVCCENDQQWTEVVDMIAGGTRVIAPRFGMEHWPRIAHIEPGRILLQGPVLLSATIRNPDGGDPRNPRVHLPGLDAAVRDLPLSAIDPEEGVYVGVVDRGSIPLGRSVNYYFTVETSAGQTLCSELYSFTAVSEVSQHLTP